MSETGANERESGLCDNLLDIRQAAKWLGIPLSTMYRLVKNGTVPALRLGRHVRISPREVLERCSNQGGAHVPGKR